MRRVMCRSVCCCSLPGDASALHGKVPLLSVNSGLGQGRRVWRVHARQLIVENGCAALTLHTAELLDQVDFRNKVWLLCSCAQDVLARSEVHVRLKTLRELCMLSMLQHSWMPTFLMVLQELGNVPLRLLLLKLTSVICSRQGILCQ